MNKFDEEGNINRNKARLVARGYIKVEGVDFEEGFSIVARLESIHLLMEFSCTLKFKLYQMEIKNVFLNEYLHEEVFVGQPKGFEDPLHPDHVRKLKKALYGLKQALRAWYETLTKYLLKGGYIQWGADSIPFIHKGKLLSFKSMLMTLSSSPGPNNWCNSLSYT